MSQKTEYMQIRVSPAEKGELKRLARAAGLDLSSYVLGRALPPVRLQFEKLLAGLEDSDGDRYVLAELNDLLSSLAPIELREAVERADVGRLTPFLANYVAAMVEQASHDAGVSPPRWTRDVDPLERPHFATEMKALRLHLLAAAPVPFKRRNIFIDSALGERV
jgi:hypothetical protein